VGMRWFVSSGCLAPKKRLNSILVTKGFQLVYVKIIIISFQYDLQVFKFSDIQGKT
jgi:hypothetical protein